MIVKLLFDGATKVVQKKIEPYEKWLYLAVGAILAAVMFVTYWIMTSQFAAKPTPTNSPKSESTSFNVVVFEEKAVDETVQKLLAIPEVKVVEKRLNTILVSAPLEKIMDIASFPEVKLIDKFSFTGPSREAAPSGELTIATAKSIDETGFPVRIPVIDEFLQNDGYLQTHTYMFETGSIGDLTRSRPHSRFSVLVDMKNDPQPALVKLLLHRGDNFYLLPQSGGTNILTFPDGASTDTVLGIVAFADGLSNPLETIQRTVKLKVQ